MKRLIPLAAVITVAAVLTLAACTGVTTPGEPADPTDPPVTEPTDPAIHTPPIEPTPVDPTPTLVVGDVPMAIMEALVDETAVLAQVALTDVRVERAEAVTWNDGSLGCPEPDMMYIQALVDGYWVVLEAAGQTYDWRMSETGLPRLCPEGEGQPPLEELPY